MAFSLGDVLVTIKANTDSLKKGIEDVQKMGDNTKTLGEKVQKGLNIAAVGLAAVGVGLTAYSKGAVSYTTDLVKSSKMLGAQLGISTSEASRLTAAMERMGIGADASSAMFGIFEKKIAASTSATAAQQEADAKLEIQITKTKDEIKLTQAAIDKHGDSTGMLGVKLAELNNTLGDQTDKLSATKGAFEALGISTTDSSGKQKDFSTILLDVADKFKAMPNGIDKTAISMELFGRQGKDMVKVLNLGSTGIADLEKQADKLGLTLNAKTIGAINDLVKEQKDLKEQTDAMKIAVGTATTPIITEFDKKVNDVLNTLMNSSQILRTATVDVLAFGGPVLGAAGAILNMTSNLVGSMPIIMGFANGIRNLTVVQWLWNAALDANPIGLIILGIAALIGGLVLLYDNSETVRKAFETAFNFILHIIQDVWNWVKGNWPILAGILLGPIALAVGEIIQHFDRVKDGARKVADAVGGFFSGMGETIKNAVKGSIDWVIDKINDMAKAYNSSVGKIPGSPKLSMIPKFAAGTNDAPGGLAIFGEKGPELGIVPSHTKLLPNNLTENLVDNLMSVSDMLRTFINTGVKGFLTQNQLSTAMAPISQPIGIVTNFNGPINIGSQGDADYLLRRIDRNAQLEGLGMTPSTTTA